MTAAKAASPASARAGAAASGDGHAPPGDELRRARALLPEKPAAQRRVWRLQRWGWAGMGLVVAAACTGLLGADGPLNAGRARGMPAGLEVAYEPVARQSRVTAWTVLLPAGADALVIEDPAGELFPPRRILPRPMAEHRVPGGLALVFHPPAAEEPLRVLIMAAPGAPGLHHLRLSSRDSLVHLRIIVLP